jgi:hypothetical protein
MPGLKQAESYAKILAAQITSTHIPLSTRGRSTAWRIGSKGCRPEGLAPEIITSLLEL